MFGLLWLAGFMYFLLYSIHRFIVLMCHFFMFPVSKVHVLEQHMSRLKENLAEREAELGDLRAEFTNYKVRAQSVLRQKARPDDGSSSVSREDHTEEVAQLKQTAEILKSKLEDVR